MNCRRETPERSFALRPNGFLRTCKYLINAPPKSIKLNAYGTARVRPDCIEDCEMLNCGMIASLVKRLAGCGVLILILTLGGTSVVQAQADTAESIAATGDVDTAPIIIDGKLLMKVRGVSAFPASERAKIVRKRIVDLARDKSIPVEKLVVVDEKDMSVIYVGDQRLMALFDADANLENLGDRKLLAEIIKSKIAEVVTEFRHDRSPRVVLQHTAYALGFTLIFVLIFWGLLRLFRALNNWAVKHVHKGVQDLASKSHHLVQAEQIWTLVAGLLSTARVLALLVLVYFYLNTVLGLFPWTRPAALILFDLVLNPVKSLWFGFVESLPDLAFLVILYLIVRYILKLERMFFTQVSRGRIKLQNFDQDWAMPTFKIIRFLTVAFAIVIAYPYIPGSDSLAFKGVSVFIGVIFSFGSSSFIANILAGLAMTYRGAFKEGDRIKIDDVFGDVEDIKLMTTRIRTLKNESVVIPNSNILNTNVTNYTVMARDPGLLLHTTVGIGYDTPWRQVEAMLMIAAERTEGLQDQPKPFVLQTLMGDFAVNYEINAYCKNAERMVPIRSDLHRNIQDVFNEHGVQIMSPAYVADPASAKIVPPDNWYVEPASKPAKK
jgi:small-conductance mechanosensitive channel